MDTNARDAFWVDFEDCVPSTRHLLKHGAYYGLKPLWEQAPRPVMSGDGWVGPKRNKPRARKMFLYYVAGLHRGAGTYRHVGRRFGISAQTARQIIFPVLRRSKLTTIPVGGTWPHRRWLLRQRWPWLARAIRHLMASERI